MKKLIMAAAALLACTASYAQPVSSTIGGSIKDVENLNIVISVPDVIDLTPEGPVSVNSTISSADLIGGTHNLNIGSINWHVWSNREWYCYYKVNSGLNMQYHTLANDVNDGDENTTWAANNIQMQVTEGSHTGNHDFGNGYLTSHWFYSPISTFSLQQIVDEASPGVDRQFTTSFRVNSPGAGIVGGVYTTTMTFTAVQE